MSSPEWSAVTQGNAASYAPGAGNHTLGPTTLYQLAQGQTATVEAVTFTITAPVVLDFNIQCLLELLDPSGNVLFRQPSPVFNFD